MTVLGTARRSPTSGRGIVTRDEFTLIIAIVLLAPKIVLPAGMASELNASAVGSVLLTSVLGTTSMQHFTTFEERGARGGRPRTDQNTAPARRVPRHALAIVLR